MQRLGVGFCKSVSVKSAVPKSAVDGAKKCGRELEKKPYPKFNVFPFNFELKHKCWVSLGYLVTKNFEGTRGWYYTNTIVPKSNLTIKSFRHREPDSILTIESYRPKTADVTEDFTRFEPDTDPMPFDGKVGIGYLMPTSPLNHWLASVTEYSRLNIESPDAWSQYFCHTFFLSSNSSISDKRKIEFLKFDILKNIISDIERIFKVICFTQDIVLFSSTFDRPQVDKNKF